MSLSEEAVLHILERKLSAIVKNALVEILKCFQTLLSIYNQQFTGFWFFR